MPTAGSNSNAVLPPTGTATVSYWRVEGSSDLALCPRRIFTWNSQSFAERWARRAGHGRHGADRPFAYFAQPHVVQRRFLSTVAAAESAAIAVDLLGEGSIFSTS